MRAQLNFFNVPDKKGEQIQLGFASIGDLSYSHPYYYTQKRPTKRDQQLFLLLKELHFPNTLLTPEESSDWESESSFLVLIRPPLRRRPSDCGINGVVSLA